MAYELLLNNFTSGLEANAAKSLATLLLFDTLTPPVTEALMRATLEAGQLQPYSNDGWLNLVSQLSNTSLNLSALTTGQRTIINTLRTIVSPPPQNVCSGVTPVTEGLTGVNAYEQLGFPNFQHEFELRLEGSVDETIQSVEVTLVPIAAAPAILTSNPFTVTFKQCSGGFKFMSNINVQFGGNPSGESYDITNLDFLDADGATITSFNPALYNWNIP
jgi:hypothetical protein